MCTLGPFRLKKKKKFLAVIWFQVTGHSRVRTSAPLSRSSWVPSGPCHPVAPTAREPAGSPGSSRHFSARCPQDPAAGGPGEGRGRRFWERRVRAGSRTHLTRAWRWRAVVPEGRRVLEKSETQLCPRLGPAVAAPRSPPARPTSQSRRRPRPARTRGRDSTCCVLKSQPRQQRRVAGSAIAAERRCLWARSSVLPAA